MLGRCPSAVLMNGGKLQDYRFIINERGVATLVSDKSHLVYGLPWKITPEDEKSLDDYEGVIYNTYYKSKVVVETAKGSNRKAMIYFANDTETGLPNKGYMELIVKAAKKHRFPDFYIAELKSWLKIRD